MTWAIEIQSTGLDKRNVIDLLGDLGYRIVEIDGIDLAVTSDSLANCNAAQEVWEQAKQLRTILTKDTEIDPDFKLGAVLDQLSTKPRQHHFLEARAIGLSFAAAGTPKLTVLPPEQLTEQERLIWEEEQKEREYQAKLERQRASLIPVIREPRAVKMLAFMRQDQHTGESLYKMYELMEGSPSKPNRSEFHTKFCVSKNEFARFKDAVHNPDVHGDFARHAQPQSLNSNDPMTPQEAQSFVYALAQGWLASLR